MSGRGDIRMYVEHLFEGRTLDAETIELKEEIYGNLVARFDDYVAQGMSEDEAYERTCEAVTSVDDVMGAERDADGEKGAGSDETVARPAVAAAAAGPTGTGAAPGPAGVPVPPPSEPARRRWGAGRVVAVVTGAVVVVAVASAVAFGVFGRGATQQTSEDVTQITEPSATTGSTGSQGGTGAGTGNGTGAGTGSGTGTGTGAGTGAQGGNGYGYGAQGATGLDAEVYAHDVSTLSPYAGMGAADSRFLEMMQALPLGAYVTSAQGDAATGTLDLAYAYDNRDALAYDDDCVDRALVYDVVAAMAVSPEVSTVRVVEEETNPYDYDRDLRVFRRATVEGILGFPLNADLLVADIWDATRDEVMTTHAWDAIWESSDVD